MQFCISIQYIHLLSLFNGVAQALIGLLLFSTQGCVQSLLTTMCSEPVPSTKTGLLDRELKCILHQEKAVKYNEMPI